MIANIPILNQFFKTSIEKPTLIMTEDERPLFDLFPEREIDLSKIFISNNDKSAIKDAHQQRIQVNITKNLDDNQLLKLHISEYLDSGYILYYHKNFDIFEVNNQGRTIYLFSYRNGLYTPIHCIY